MSSFGAHAYLLPRPGGNLMIDAPRFDAALAERVKALGGIAHVLLTHRDDVAEAAEWAATFGSLVWIHEDERDAAPFATEILSAERPEDIAPGVAWLQTPGHTKGHVAFHVDDAWLFTGDTLHWNPRRDELDVFPKQVFDSWEALAASMDVLAQLRVEWVFAGHGSWQNVGAEAYAEHMKAMGPTMREVGQHPWSHRPGTSFAWF
jgi:glyoxylase-like metal-dependent hydrolase (beta-lactamase superfamily II)